MTNLAAEIRASGDHKLAAKLLNAAAHDEHVADHNGMFVADCDFCCAECAFHDLDIEHDGTVPA